MMSLKTINDENLKEMTKIDNPDYEEVPNYCINIVVDIQPVKIFQEFSEEEMLTLPEKIGMFSFLANKEEDIYNENDGTPLE